ncbi:hypothetical protein CJ030_MR2G006071 [Morella rubra]|uniref:Uncharacterized protein n=1 Tax=Morella rubra TaxID=262757 RepID=A0A6A1WFI6_9ROSI|nr:hypothetical protein CJ030_MR2G006071 [Morella rubra]
MSRPLSLTASASADLITDLLLQHLMHILANDSFKLDGRAEYKTFPSHVFFLLHIGLQGPDTTVGEEWITKHEEKVKQFANYEPAWSKVIASQPENPAAHI